MDRARAGILSGARATINQSGIRRMTMSGVAEHGGVAKATVYNHFRSRGELLDALLADELRLLNAAADEAGDDVSAQLAAAATRISTNPLLAAMRQHEPELLATLAGFTAGELDGRWLDVVDSVRERLSRCGCRDDNPVVNVVLRWLVSVAVAPTADLELREEAMLIGAALR
jgi:AcrR family transcriptional regulator